MQLYRPGFIAGASLDLALSGAGYLPVRLSGSFGAEAGYPGAFAPIDLGVVSLHREPVTIAGRAVSHGGAVRAGATVSLDGAHRVGSVRRLRLVARNSVLRFRHRLRRAFYGSHMHGHR